MASYPLTNIHSNAKIGKNVKIDPFATIYEDVEIGDNSWVGSNAVIMNGARIGKNCKIFPGAIISADSQDLKYKGEYATTIIGDNTTIREYVTIHKGTADKKTTVIGKNCLLMSYVHIAHDCVIGDWVIIEGTAAVQQFVNIGEHTFIAGGSLVRKNVPPYVKAAREPLSYVGVNTIGLRRRGFNDQQIVNIEDIYRVIYVQNSNITTALSVAELEIPVSDEKEVVLDFIRDSTKGIMRGLS